MSGEFPATRGPLTVEEVDKLEILDHIACELARSWSIERRDARLVRSLHPAFVSKLDQLERFTKGRPHRCMCQIASKGHASDCPARAPAEKR